MKKILFAAVLALVCLTSCRDNADYIANPYLYEYIGTLDASYRHQFESIWQGINSGYAFWDVETIDWDERYSEYSAKLTALETDSEDGSISNEDLQAFYDGLCGDLKDHHMAVIVKNIVTGDKLWVKPGDNEVTKRSYYHEPLSWDVAWSDVSNIDAVLSGVIAEDAMGAVATVGETETQVISCLFKLPDGRYIPYLWQSGYDIHEILPVLAQYETVPDAEEDPAGYYAYLAATAMDNYFTWVCGDPTGGGVPDELLAGIILDNRSNGGGLMMDMNYVVGLYLNEPTPVIETRCKNGVGRLDYAPWVSSSAYPNTVYPTRDITSKNIPYVILQDCHSLSMGELSGLGCRAALPTSHIIGERSYGGQGSLVPSLTPMLNYGSFGDAVATNGHYVYIVNYATRIPGGEILEGKGTQPDKEVLVNDVGTIGQLRAGIEYITSYAR